MIRPKAKRVLRSTSRERTAELTPSYRLQMCSMGVLSIPLTEQEMNALYQIHHCDTFSLTEQTSSEAWQAMQQRFLEKVGCERMGVMDVERCVLRSSQYARHEVL